MFLRILREEGGRGIFGSKTMHGLSSSNAERRSPLIKIREDKGFIVELWLVLAIEERIL